jgi:peptidoglycan hydrolase-like protein with peptidoglycan-binding domain
MKAQRTRRTEEPDEDETIGLADRLAAAVRARPKAVALTLAVVVSMSAISVNALYLQSGKHPAPMFSHQPAGVRTASLSADLDPAPAGLPAAISSPERDDATAAAAPDNLVSAVQTALKARGLYTDPVDGAMGPATRAAISAYEQKMGLEVTGAPSVGLLASLSSPAPTPPKAPQTASAQATAPSKALLQRLQKALVAAGYGPITVDGLYGSETAGAIRRYQLDHGMSVNGTVSDPLLARLGVVAAQPEG